MNEDTVTRAEFDDLRQANSSLAQALKKLMDIQKASLSIMDDLVASSGEALDLVQIIMESEDIAEHVGEDRLARMTEIVRNATIRRAHVNELLGKRNG